MYCIQVTKLAELARNAIDRDHKTYVELVIYSEARSKSNQPNINCNQKSSIELSSIYAFFWNLEKMCTLILKINASSISELFSSFSFPDEEKVSRISSEFFKHRQQKVVIDGSD